MIGENPGLLYILVISPSLSPFPVLWYWTFPLLLLVSPVCTFLLFLMEYGVSGWACVTGLRWTHSWEMDPLWVLGFWLTPRLSLSKSQFLLFAIKDLGSALIKNKNKKHITRLVTVPGSRAALRWEWTAIRSKCWRSFNFGFCQAEAWSLSISFYPATISLIKMSKHVGTDWFVEDDVFLDSIFYLRI